MGSRTSITQNQEFQSCSEQRGVFSLVFEEKGPRAKLTDYRNVQLASEGCSR